MKTRGQLQAIHVRKRDGKFKLLVGLHRLKAAKKLGWEEIRGIIHYDLSDDQAQLIEIDENLIRADLSPAERAAHLTARKEIYERLHPDAKRGGDRRSNSQLESLIGFSADTARKTGRGESTVAREVARAEAIPEIGKVAGTSLDKGVELDALAKLPEREQHEKLALSASSGPSPVAPPDKPTVEAPTEPQGAGEPAGMSSTTLADQQDGASEPAKQSRQKRKSPTEVRAEHISESAGAVGSGVKALALLKEAKDLEYVNQVFEHLINDENLINALAEIARYPKAAPSSRRLRPSSAAMLNVWWTSASSSSKRKSNSKKAKTQICVGSASDYAKKWKNALARPEQC